jgi:hypothetical protein
MFPDLKSVRWSRLVGAAAHAAFSVAWAISAPAQGLSSAFFGPSGLKKDESSRLAGVRVSSVLVAASAWSAACGLAAALARTSSESAWLLDAVDATDAVVAWTALTVAVAAVVALPDTAAACYVALNTVVVLLAATWVAPAKRKQALLRSAAASVLAHCAAAGVALYAATQSDRRYALGVVTVHGVAAAAAASAFYAFDTARCALVSAPQYFDASLPRYALADSPPRNASPHHQTACSRESFEAEARAASQLTCRLSVAFAFWAEEMRVARRAAAAATEAPTTLVPPETLEVLAPVACVAFFGIWLLFAYPEKQQKPYYDGPVGSLRGARGDACGTGGGGGGHNWGTSLPAPSPSASEPRPSSSRHAMTTQWTSPTSSMHAGSSAVSTAAAMTPPTVTGGVGGSGAGVTRSGGTGGGGTSSRPREPRAANLKPKFQHTPAPSFEFTL